MPEKSSWKDNLQIAATMIQVLTVVVGVVISVVTLRHSQDSERTVRALESAKPFLQMRQQVYIEALKMLEVLSTPEQHSVAELDSAKKRFVELYYGELPLVEGPDTQKAMEILAESVARLQSPTETQVLVRKTAHVLRDSLIISWRVDPSFTGTLPQ